MNGDGKTFASALLKMATSPVKADREAIARIEREFSANITDLTTLLENSEIVLLASQTEKRSNKPKILATGMFWAGVIGIIAMLARPGLMWEGVSLGFVVGSAGAVLLKEN